MIMNLSSNIVAFGIAILLTILVFLSIELFYPQPKDYYDYYNDCYYRFNCEKEIIDCERRFEQNSSEYETMVNECRNEILKSQEYKDCLNEQYLCNQESFKKSSAYNHSKISFFILVFVGVVIILSSIFLICVEGLRAGFMLSGILVIIISTLKSWSYLMYNRGLGIFIILSVLMVLIFYSYKNNILEVSPRKQKTKNIRDSKKKKEKRN